MSIPSFDLATSIPRKYFIDPRSLISNFFLKILYVGDLIIIITPCDNNVIDINDYFNMFLLTNTI